MAVLEGGDRAVIERFTGPILPNEEESMGERVSRLGNAYAAAIEVCMMRLAGFEQTPSDVKSGDDHVRFESNVASAKASLERLTGFLAGNTDISLGVEGEGLLAAALGNRPGGLTSVDMVRSNNRLE